MTMVPLPPGKRKRHFFGPHDMTLIDEDRDDEDGDEADQAEKK